MIRVKEYISWSQLSMFESSPSTYKKCYIDGERLPINRGMALGKEVADSLERSKDTGDLNKDLIISQLPKLDEMEKEIKATIKVGDYDIPLLGYLDTAKKNLSEFKEYKTGKTPWNKKKVDEHGQITFYCTIIQALTGKIPKNIELVHAVTETSPDGSYELTGEIRRYPTVRTLKDILKMKIRIKNAWIGIGQMWEDEIL